MASYIQIEFSNISAEQSDILVAELTAAGYEGFEEGETLLKAFIPADNFNEEEVQAIAEQHQTSFTISTIEETNWNAVWESNFEPITIDDFVGLRADFHSPIRGVEHEIVITPKMSFGTGHHATTYMMIQQMRDIDFTDKPVFDFGTGTGVLAILAERLGANKILAVDNDDWSIANTAENIERNNCHRIELRKVETVPAQQSFDIILANINKNVLLENMAALAAQLAPGGTLLLSGLLTEDEQDILSAAGKFSLELNNRTERNNWIALGFNC